MRNSTDPHAPLKSGAFFFIGNFLYQDNMLTVPYGITNFIL